MSLLRYYARLRMSFSVFFFNATATTEIYTLSLHDALPISSAPEIVVSCIASFQGNPGLALGNAIGSNISNIALDRKSTRLNSSHVKISYAVFCLKKKKKDEAKEGNSLDLDRTIQSWGADKP